MKRERKGKRKREIKKEGVCEAKRDRDGMCV
jgi:hypothetical protein